MIRKIELCPKTKQTTKLDNEVWWFCKILISQKIAGGVMINQIWENLPPFLQKKSIRNARVLTPSQADVLYWSLLSECIFLQEKIRFQAACVVLWICIKELCFFISAHILADRSCLPKRCSTLFRKNWSPFLSEPKTDQTKQKKSCLSSSDLLKHKVFHKIGKIEQTISPFFSFLRLRKYKLRELVKHIPYGEGDGDEGSMSG